MGVGINHIEYYFPKNILYNNDFKNLDVDPDFLEKRIGIQRRYISDDNEGVSDMSIKACEKLIISGKLKVEDINILIFCTQNPDYILPQTSALIQNKLGISKNSICFDINLGCSGFVYGLSIIKSMMMNLNLKKGLLINAEAYSKIINKKDRTVVTLFSDAASVAILENGSSYSDIVSFNFGTDGTGYKNLIVPVGGSKSKRNENTAKVKKFSQGTFRSQENLFMDGYEISKFVYKEIPQSIFHLINEAGQNIDSIDRYFFHQPNKYLLESLSQRMKIDPQKVYIDLSNGNTVSCSIPIALKDFYTINKSVEDKILLLSGFGVGYSWANSIIKINNKFKENI